MMKYEFEAIANVEVTDEMYETIEKMYIAADMDKREFIKMLNLKAIAKETEKEIVTIEVCRCSNGTIVDFEAELLDIDIATGKAIVRRLSENRAWGRTCATYRECDCILK